MPKGVEHIRSAVPPDANQEVQRPLMPKGVEHIEKSFARKTFQVVQRPLMPKGVEHSSFLRQSRRVLTQCRDL